MSDETRFYDIEPSLENYWRAIILFGRNVASYKFALAKALYELRKAPNELITLEELSPYFADAITEHLKLADKQGTSAQSRFLELCRQYNNGEVQREVLLTETAKLGFNNVIDAFHNVHGDTLPRRFFLDERKTNNGIRLTDDFYNLMQQTQAHDLYQETEARWRLVETAWSLNLPKQVVQISHDPVTNNLHTQKLHHRINITPARDALNGYQKGRCFYCYRPISIDAFSRDLADVDHFFPHKLKACSGDKPVDGVANLVLACQECNRGVSGKFDRLPTLLLLERLHKRNEYLIKSHHPLRETLMLQTGLTPESRKDFLQSAYQCSHTHIISRWQPQAQGIAIF